MHEMLMCSTGSVVKTLPVIRSSYVIHIMVANINTVKYHSIRFLIHYSQRILLICQSVTPEVA